MTVKIVNTEFNGHWHKTGMPVESIGVTVEEDFWSDPELYPKSISFYAALIDEVRSVVGKKRLYEIAANVKEAPFSRVEIYKGLDQFKKAKQQVFQNDSFSVMAGCRELVAEQIRSSLCADRMDRVICFTEPAVAESLFAQQNEKIFSDFGKLKDQLISKFSVIVELLDLSYDGNTLFFYGLPENQCLGKIEDFLRKKYLIPDVT